MTTGYTLPPTSEEYQRLRVQAGFWRPATGRLLDEAGVGAGMRCLDVGCGPGEVMRLLGERVGASGSVTGLDIDDTLGRQAAAMLNAAGPARFDFRHGDIRHLPGSRRYDVVTARLLLMHLPDPVSVLRTLHDRVEPGGVLVVQDYDARVMDAWPRLDTWPEFVGTMLDVVAASGGDATIGTKLPGYLLAAVGGTPDHVDVAGALVPLHESADLCADTYRNVLPLALRLGITTRQRADGFLDELAVATRERNTWLQLPNLVGVVKHKATD